MFEHLLSCSTTRRVFTSLSQSFIPLVVAAGMFVFPALRTGQAQVLFGSIVGNITDASGAGVPGATVKVTQIETNESRETQTTETGAFTLTTVHTGTYKFLAAKAGFQNFTSGNVAVTLNSVVRVDAVLQIGTQSQSVDVTAESAALQTDKSDVHDEFNSKVMTELPQPTRSFEGIVGLMPGVSAPPAASSGGTN